MSSLQDVAILKTPPQEITKILENSQFNVGDRESMRLEKFVSSLKKTYASDSTQQVIIKMPKQSRNSSHIDTSMPEIESSCLDSQQTSGRMANWFDSEEPYDDSKHYMKTSIEFGVRIVKTPQKQLNNLQLKYCSPISHDANDPVTGLLE